MKGNERDNLLRISVAVCTGAVCNMGAGGVSMSKIRADLGSYVPAARCSEALKICERKE